MNNKKSELIYNQLIQGKYINKDLFDKDKNILEDNILFIEIDTYFSDYQDFYLKIGMKLNKETEFIYLSRIKDKEEEFNIDKQQYKQFFLINIIFRYLLNKNKSLDDFKNKDIGISEDIIDNIFKEPEYSDFFEHAEITNSNSPINLILEKRNIVYKNANDNYVLTNIGISFLNKIEQVGANINEGFEDEKNVY
jgi:hypothetical protein